MGDDARDELQRAAAARAGGRFEQHPAAARLDVTWAGSRDGLWDWDLAANELRLSPRWKAIVGCAPDELGATPEEWFRRVHPEDAAALRSAIERLLTGELDTLQSEFRLQHKNGSWRWVRCNGVMGADRSLLGGSLTDVTELKISEERLLHEFFHDDLTSLPNRALFLDRLGQALYRTRLRKGSPLAVLYLDLDRFHTVNNSLGVGAGDELLIEVAERIAKVLRPGDTLARLGGDKFAALLDGVGGPTQAVQVAEAIAEELSASLRLGEHEVFASASVGIALSAARHNRAEDLLRDAIAAMHRAKEDGATRHMLFDPRLNERAKERLHLEADLRRAVERGQLRLHYQPIISFSSGELTAFEALLRWQHPERGLVGPDIFIPVAEETGLIVGIGSWVLEEACRQMKEWSSSLAKGNDLAVAVNLSARQFEDAELVGEISACLDRTGLEPRFLELEMTESVVMARTHDNTSRLQALRDIGMRLLIDDFGTGYSSLASLHTFPLDTLKIDRSFVDRMEFEEERAEIVRTIISLAKKLGMTVVAEGVETAAQLAMLRELECEHGQGYYFSSAMDGESATAWIADPPRW